MSVKGAGWAIRRKFRPSSVRQRRCPAQAGPVSDRSPVDGLPLARAVVPLDSASDRRGIRGRAVQVGQFGGRFLRASRTIVERDQARAADRGDELDELREGYGAAVVNCSPR